MPKTEPKKETIRLISGIYPADELESFHKEDAISWIHSGAQLFRISKPDNPPKHLVSYFVSYDETKNMILLIASYRHFRGAFFCIFSPWLTFK